MPGGGNVQGAGPQEGKPREQEQTLPPVLDPCYCQGILGHFPGLKKKGYLLVRILRLDWRLCFPSAE